MQQILVVDDAALMRDTAREIIERQTFRVAGEARDGEEALELFAELRPDFVLLDLVLPGRSGLQVLEAIRQLDARVSIVVSVGLGQETLAAEAIANGADDSVLKPFHPRRLLAALWRNTRKPLAPAC